MLNPTTLTFGYEYGEVAECKMIVSVEETNVEVYFNLFDENGIHQYNAEFHNMHFNDSFIPIFAKLFANYAYDDTEVTSKGWSCATRLKNRLTDMF